MSKDRLREFIQRIPGRAEFTFEGIFIRVSDPKSKLNSLVQIQWLVSLNAETQKFFQVLVMSEKFQTMIKEKINRREASPVKLDQQNKKSKSESQKSDKSKETDAILIDDSPPRIDPKKPMVSTEKTPKENNTKNTPKTHNTKTKPPKQNPDSSKKEQAQKKLDSIREKITADLHKSNFVICGLIKETKDEIACGGKESFQKCLLENFNQVINEQMFIKNLVEIIINCSLTTIVQLLLPWLMVREL